MSGRPIAIWRNADALNLNVSDATGSEPAGISEFDLWGENRGADPIGLEAAYLISPIDGSKIKMKIWTTPGGWVDIENAGPVPPTATFHLQATFVPDGQEMMTEITFPQRWGGFSVVIRAGSQTLTHEVAKSDIQKRIDIAHPDRTPHVGPRTP